MTMESVRYLRKNFNQNERDNFSNWWYEYIQHYGTLCYYYINAYSLTGHDYLYGEEPTQSYFPSAEMIILASVNNDNLLFSKFGIQCDADLTCVIHICGFRETFNRMNSSVHPIFAGAWFEPKAGDIIKLAEYGWDRPGADSGAEWTYPASGVKTEDDSYIPPGGHPSWEAWKRGGPMFTISERKDEDLTMANSLIGHYVWIIKGKRFDYSYERGIEPEDGSEPVVDPKHAGLVPGGKGSSTPDKIYDDNVEDESNKLFNYPDPGDGKCRNNQVYGGYE